LLILLTKRLPTRFQVRFALTPRIAYFLLVHRRSVIETLVWQFHFGVMDTRWV